VQGDGHVNRRSHKAIQWDCTHWPQKILAGELKGALQLNDRDYRSDGPSTSYFDPPTLDLVGSLINNICGTDIPSEVCQSS
jgi:hypothetical protein